MSPLTIPSGCHEHLRSSHTVFQVPPWKLAGSVCPQQHIQQQQTNITTQQIYLKRFGLYRATLVN